jgi:hypothetical protein
MRPRVKRKGIALILSLIFLALFSTLAVYTCALSVVNVEAANNQHLVNTAYSSASSGLEVMKLLMSNITVAGSTSPSDILSTIASNLQANLASDGMSNITAAFDGSVISIASVNLDSQSGRSFSATIQQTDSDTLQLNVTGVNSRISRAINTNFDLIDSVSAAFNFGLATKGKLEMSGNASVEGVDNPAQASIYIEALDEYEALNMSGNASIAGDVGIAETDAAAFVSGNASIGGERSQDAIENHVSYGAELVELPEPNISVFEPYAINVVDSSTSTSGNITFENIRIAAYTDPTFSGNININGIVFIESPNLVNFSGNTIITGVIVAAGDKDSPMIDDKLNFSGNLTALGVENLSDDPAFDGLRDLTGTAILAPGFELNCTGNFSINAGAIAASGIEFSGNAQSSVTGTIINYSEKELKLGGNGSILCDPGANGKPSGFDGDKTLEFMPESYSENASGS